jgi:hypothetical protein
LKQLKVWHYLLFFFLILVLAGAGIRLLRPVHAQTETILSFSPGLTELYFNGVSTAQVQVVITDVELLNAFDITITYDPDVAIVTAWSKGGFLSNLFDIVKVNNPGFFRLATTQLATPGVSGSGVLINLTFSGVGVGSTVLNFDAVTLSNSSSQSIPVTLQNGTVTAGYHANAISGAIFAQGQTGRAGIPATLGVGATYGQGPFTVNSAPDYGLNLLFAGIPNGDTYIFTTALPGYLNVETALAKTVTLTSTDLTLPPLQLLAGDVLADNVINTADLDTISTVFGTTGEGLAADVNADGIVDVRDLALAAGNFSLTAADAYADWVP